MYPQKIPEKEKVAEWTDGMILGGKHRYRIQFDWPTVSRPNENLENSEIKIFTTRTNDKADHHSIIIDDFQRLHFAMSGDTWGILYAHRKELLKKVS